MNPGGRPKQKPLTDALRTMIFQPLTPKGNLGRPKKMTAAQGIAWRMITDALAGDTPTAAIIFNRLDGPVSANDHGDNSDIPPPQSREITLKEAARRIAFLLLSQQPDDDEAAVIIEQNDGNSGL